MTQAPRIEPLPDSEWTDEIRAIIESTSAMGREPLNIFTTLAHHPKLMKRWLVFGNSILAKGILDPRERELAILRTGWNCRSEYEFGQHVVIGRSVGITDEEIVRLTAGPDADGWSAIDATILRAADELHTDQCIGESTWAALTDHLDTAQVIELIMTVGQYHLVAMTLNSAGVQLDDGVPGFADLGLTP
jgi:alkylhydroperoxidase family enzyme